jgi:hypothetical protein
VMFTKSHQCFLRTTRNGLNVSSRLTLSRLAYEKDASFLVEAKARDRGYLKFFWIGNIPNGKYLFYNATLLR